MSWDCQETILLHLRFYRAHVDQHLHLGLCGDPTGSVEVISDVPKDLDLGFGNWGLAFWAGYIASILGRYICVYGF